MDEWLKSKKHIFDGWKFKLFLTLLIIILMIGVIYGPNYFAYIAAVIVFAIFYISAKQSEFETEIKLSDEDVQQMKVYLKELEDELSMVLDKIDDSNEDEELKSSASLLKEEITALKNAIPES